MHHRLLALLALCLAIPAAGFAAPAEGPTPDVPDLVAGGGAAAPGPRSFVVEGICRFAKTGGLAFRVAADGGRQVVALYDPADGTPLFLSDGTRTLVYDLSNGRVALVPSARGYLRLGWEPGAERPMSFDLGVGLESNPQKLEKWNAWVRLEPFVAASRAKLERLKSAPGRVLFAAERADAVESIDKPAEDDGSFRFTSLEKGKDFYRLELEARHVGRPLPEGALAFPDVKELAADVPLKEIDASIIAAFAALLRDGRAWMAKMVFAVGPDVPDRAKAMALGADWDVLRRRDKELGATYRAALARQGVKLRTYEVQPD